MNKIPYLIALVVVAALCLGGIIFVFTSTEPEYQVASAGAILGFGTSITTGLFSLIKSTENSQEITKVHEIVNSRSTAQDLAVAEATSEIEKLNATIKVLLDQKIVAAKTAADLAEAKLGTSNTSNPAQREVPTPGKTEPVPTSIVDVAPEVVAELAKLTPQKNLKKEP